MMPKSAKRYTPDRLPGYSESEVIEEIRRVIVDECGGIVPSRDRFESLARVSHWTIAKRFGTYMEGIRQAGFTVHRQFTSEQVRANLLQVLDQAKGNCFTQDFYYKNGGAYSVDVIKTRLGVRNWKSALEAIGARKQPRIVHTVVSAQTRRCNFLANLTETDLFKEIDRVWQAKGARPTYSEFRVASSFGVSVYRTHFGSWLKAVEAFCKNKGVEFSARHRSRCRILPTKAVLLEELRAVQIKRPGTVLTYATYKANGGAYSRSVFCRYFNSWTSAVNAAGGVSGRQAKHSKDDLFDEIQRMWEQLGRQPKQIEMLKQGKISPHCYADKFGSWTRAVHAFCADRNDDPEPAAIPEAPRCDDERIEQVEPEKPISIANEETEPLVIVHATGKTVPPKLRWRVFVRDNFTCRACGRSKANVEHLILHADHIVAYTKGGETELSNLQTLCWECNVGKSNL